MEYKFIKDSITGELSVVQLTRDDGVIMSIPLDEANADYQEYIAWTKASPKNVAVEAD